MNAFELIDYRQHGMARITATECNVVRPIKANQKDGQITDPARQVKQQL